MTRFFENRVPGHSPPPGCATATQSLPTRRTACSSAIASSRPRAQANVADPQLRTDHIAFVHKLHRLRPAGRHDRPVRFRAQHRHLVADGHTQPGALHHVRQSDAGRHLPECLHPGSPRACRRKSHTHARSSLFQLNPTLEPAAAAHRHRTGRSNRPITRRKSPTAAQGAGDLLRQNNHDQSRAGRPQSGRSEAQRPGSTHDRPPRAPTPPRR